MKPASAITTLGMNLTGQVLIDLKKKRVKLRVTQNAVHWEGLSNLGRGKRLSLGGWQVNPLGETNPGSCHPPHPDPPHIPEMLSNLG